MGKGSLNDYGMMLDSWRADGKNPLGIKASVRLLTQSNSATEYGSA